MTAAPVDELAERAVAWALARRGDRSYALRCLAFVEDAYERANGIEVFGGASAAESAQLYGTRPYDHGTPPPIGAFVFYACSGPIDDDVRAWGHVGLALGGGGVVHAWDEVRTDDAPAVGSLPVRAGWTSPALLGWAPPARILTGHRPRHWPDADGG